MSNRSVIRRVALVLALTGSVGVSAQQIPVLYGSPINSEMAKKVATAALAEARKNKFAMAVAVVDPSGELVYFEKIDGTQAASNDIAIDKARSSVRFKRPTKVFQDAITKGGVEMRYLTLRGVVAAEGGIPLVVGNVIVGAIGVSGGTGAQDEQVAEAGVAASK